MARDRSSMNIYLCCDKETVQENAGWTASCFALKKMKTFVLSAHLPLPSKLEWRFEQLLANDYSTENILNHCDIIVYDGEKYLQSISDKPQLKVEIRDLVNLDENQYLHLLELPDEEQ